MLAIEHELTGQRPLELGRPLVMDNPLAVQDFDVAIHGMMLPNEGKHWLLLGADGVPIQQHPLFVRVNEAATRKGPMRRTNTQRLSSGTGSMPESSGKRRHPAAMTSVLIAQEPLCGSVAEATPANSVLLANAQEPGKQPPGSWWDERENPFVSDAEQSAAWRVQARTSVRPRLSGSKSRTREARERNVQSWS